jgi:hypothetical protein
MTGAPDTPRTGSDGASMLSDPELSYPLNPDSPHARNAIAAKRRVRFYLIDVAGLSAEKIDALIPTLRKVMEERELVPVFVTDLLDHGVLRRHGVIFEAVPPLAGSAALAPDLDWCARRAECLALIRGKWQPVGGTVLGPGVGGTP